VVRDVLEPDPADLDVLARRDVGAARWLPVVARAVVVLARDLAEGAPLSGGEDAVGNAEAPPDVDRSRNIRFCIILRLKAHKDMN
jgi:hypothetical protein